MSHADTIGSDVFSQLLKVVVTKVARSHLYAHLMQVGIGFGVKMDNV